MTSKKFVNHQMHECDLTKKGQISDGEYSPPRLSEAVVHAMPSGGGSLFELSPYKESMAKLFQHIYDRLDKGLDDAWRSTWGYDGDIEDTPNENWARMFAEMFIFTSYMGVAEAYRTKHGDDGKWDMEYVVRLDYGVEDPVYPIVGACQHLANYAILTRGFPASALGRSGLGAGVNAGVPCYTSKHGGSWTVTSTGASTEIGGYRGIANINKKLSDAGKGSLTPGSMFGFNADGPNPKLWNDTHIGGVLRIWSKTQYQPMDTGVLAGVEEGGTADHDAKTSVEGMANKMVGIGVLKSVDPSPALIQFLGTARPLGFAHFVVADESNTVRFISRALPMYHGQKGFAISRYVWSLRCFPARGKGLWILSIPQVEALSIALREKGARYTPLSALIAGLAKSVSATNGAVLMPVNVLASTKGIPDQGHQDQGMDDSGKTPRWRGYASGAIVFRHKKHGGDKPEDVWIRYRGANEPVVKGKPFPKEVMDLKFVEGGTFDKKWSAMNVDEEYTCADPADASNPQVADITKGVVYFSGVLEKAPPRASPDERIIAGKKGMAPVDDKQSYQNTLPPAWQPPAADNASAPSTSPASSPDTPKPSPQS